MNHIISDLLQNLKALLPPTLTTTDRLLSLSPKFEQQIKEKYEIVEVDWLDKTMVQYKMFSNENFKKSIEKTAMINHMLDYYLTHADKKIYKKVDYLCNEKEGVCICNTNADAFRKVYDRNNYVPEYKYIYMVSDLLAFEGIAYITEDDVRAEPSLMSLFSDLTPDLIVKSAPPRRTTIIDIYIGRDQAAIDKKKSKYKGMAVTFDFIGVTELSMCRDLKSVLSDASTHYLASQFHVFKTEYQYWKSCAKLQRMLVNEVQNVPLKPLPVVGEFVALKDKFLEALVTKAQTLLNDDGI